MEFLKRIFGGAGYIASEVAFPPSVADGSMNGRVSNTGAGLGRTYYVPEFGRVRAGLSLQGSQSEGNLVGNFFSTDTGFYIAFAAAVGVGLAIGGK